MRKLLILCVLFLSCTSASTDESKTISPGACFEAGASCGHMRHECVYGEYRGDEEHCTLIKNLCIKHDRECGSNRFEGLEWK